MIFSSNIEKKELYTQFRKLLVFAYMVDTCRTNIKQMKHCLKLIKSEQKIIRKSKSVLSVANQQKVAWNYMDLYKFSKALMQKSAVAISKATADFDEFIKKLEFETEKLKIEVAVRENKTVQNITEKVTEKVTETIGASKEKISEVVSSGIEKLKKVISRDAD